MGVHRIDVEVVWIVCVCVEGGVMGIQTPQVLTKC
jgi:hypothetical protein